MEFSYNNLEFSFSWQYVLKPTFTKQQIANLDKQAKLSRAYDGTTYLPGIVGLNNIKANDYANAVLQVGSGRPLGRKTGSRVKAARESCSLSAGRRSV